MSDAGDTWDRVVPEILQTIREAVGTVTSVVTARVRVTVDVALDQPWSTDDTAARIRAAAERDALEQVTSAMQRVGLCRVVGIAVSEVKS
jgi:hypothetical protein